MSVSSTTRQERRKEPRLNVSEGSLFLRWEDRGRTWGIRAEVVDLSEGGALVLAPIAVPEHREVEVAFGGMGSGLRVLAVVVGLIEGRRWNQIRLVFREPCPRTVLEDARSAGRF
jgi:hypothetical protein